MKGPLFYAKILLFGEYGIIKDSKGLSIPYELYGGVLKKTKQPTKQMNHSHQSLVVFYEYIKKIAAINQVIDIPQMKKDLDEFLYFDSTIPEGYGVGSSGALVAAVYDRYAKEKISVLQNLTKERLATLKNIFAQMESFFHGNSSGLDPLNSYLSLPLLIHSKDNLDTTMIPHQTKGKSAIFLIDSSCVGKTSNMVEIFMNKMKYEGFRKMFSEEFAVHTDACIEHFLKGNILELFTDVKKLSKFVLKHFKPMIPDSFHTLWKRGIETNQYYLKLCGSGGGGYILGFAKDYQQAKKALKGKKIQLVYQF